MKTASSSAFASITSAVVLGMVVCCAVATPTRTQTIFSDNFDSGASPQWGNQSGNWAANRGVYQALNPSSTAFSFLPFALTDFTVDVDIHNVADGGLWLRSDGTGMNGILLVTGGEGWGWDARTPAAGTSLYFQMVQNGAYGPYLGEVTGLFSPGVSDIHLRVEPSGNNYAVFLNGASTPVTSITDSTFSSGEVGLYDFSSQSFDNFSIQEATSSSQVATIYVANSGNNTITKFTDGVVSVFASTGLSQPQGLALDNAGNLYVANFGNNTIEKFTPGGIGSVFANTGLNGPVGLGFDSAGNLFVANQFSGTIVKFTPGGVGTVFATGLFGASAIAFDGAGNLYTAASPNIYKVTPGGVSSSFASGLNQPTLLAFDTAGNLYAGSLGNERIDKFTPGGVASIFASTGLNYPYGMAFDSQGNLYVANVYGNSVVKFTPDGMGSVFADTGLNGPTGIAVLTANPPPPTCATPPSGLVSWWRGEDANVLTFDELPATSPGYDWALIPNGYGGLQWSNFGVLNGMNRPVTEGYRTGVVSPENVAFSFYGNPAAISRATPFTLTSAQLTAAFVNGLEMRVQGWRGTTLVYSNAYVLTTTGPTLIKFNYAGVDRVTFTPGVPSGFFALDNLVIDGSGLARDSADGNNGTLTGNTTIGPGRVGHGLVFSANGDAVQLGNPINLQLQNFTIEAWVKRTSAFRATIDPRYVQGAILQYGNGGYGFAMLDDGRLYLTKVESGQVTSTIKVADTNFHHIAVTKSGSTVTFYVDGTAEVVAPFDPGFEFTSPVAIGARGSDLRHSFWGTIDELAVYNRALSTGEVQSIYAVGSAGKCQPPPPACIPPPSDIVAWWRGESNTVDSVAGNNGIMVPTDFPTFACYQTGKVDAAFSFAGPNYVSIPRSDILDVGKAEGLTLEAWINPSQFRSMPILEWTDSNSFGASLWMSYYRGPSVLEADLIDVSGAVHLVQSPVNTLTYNAWQHVALTYDKASGQAALYVNGNPVATTNLGSFTPRTDTDLLLGFHPRSTGQGGYGAPPYLQTAFVGSMDEVDIYRRALAAGEIRAIVQSRSGKCLELPPTIGRQPQDQIVLEGETATFDVAVGGTEPLSCQWFFDGAAIRGANGSTLQLVGSAMADAGDYSVIVSSAFGSATSQVATLTVLPANQCLPTPLGVVAFWRGESNTVDEVGNHPASWMNTTPGYTTPQTGGGKVGTAFRFARASYLLQVPADPDLNVAAGGGFTVEGWIKPDSALQPQAIVDWNDGLGNVGVGLMLSGPAGPGTLQVMLTDTNAISSQERTVTYATPSWTIGSPTNPIPDWTHIALTFDKAKGKSVLFVNGRPVAEQTIAPIRTRTIYEYAPFTPATTGDLYFGWRRFGTYSGSRFWGAMDEMTIYYRALTPLEVQAIFSVGSNGKCTPQPACLSPDAGIVSWWRGESNVLDSVGNNHGSNRPAAFYTINGLVGISFYITSGRYIRIPASSSLDVGSGPRLTFETWVKPDNRGYYTIAAWNNGNGEQGVSLGSSYTRGPPYLEVNLVDAHGDSHVMSSPYRAITNGAWQQVATTYDKLSGQAVLYVNGSPVALTNLGVFTPRTTGNLYLGYRPPGPYPGSGWGFDGAMDEVAVYSRALSSGEITAHYRNASNRCMQLPVIVKHPASLRVNAGSDVALSVEAVGNPVLRYQWFKNGEVIYDRNQRPATNAIMPSLKLTSVGKFDQGVYHVVVSNAFGWAISSNAVLLVNYPPVADATATKPLLIVPTGCSPTVVLDGSRSSDPDGDPLHYLWFKTGEASAFATGVVAVVTLPLGANPLTLVVDDGLATNAQTFTMKLITSAQAVERLIALVNSQAQKPNPLVATLSAALASIERGDVTPAINQLQAFQNKVRAQVKADDPTLGGQFTQAAQDIVDALSHDCASAKPHVKIESVERHSNGKVKMAFSAPDGPVYLIEASTNLVDWEKIGVATEGSPGEFEFEDTSAASVPMRFYRIIVQ